MLTTGFKRIGFALLAVILAVAGALTVARLVISADSVRQQALSEIRDVTGLDPMLRGATSVSTFPSGRISFDDVVLGTPDHPALVAERLTARLRLLPLLMGRAEIADVTLERPIITIDLGAADRSNWSGLIEGLTRGRRTGATTITSFSEMRIEDGTVTVRDAARKIEETLTNVELSLAWPSISKSFGATGRFNWHGATMDTTFTLADFAAALAGNRTGVRLRIAGAPLKAAFEGSASLKPTLKIEGTIAADSTSLRDTLTWSGRKALPGGGFGRFALKAQTTITGGTIGLSAVNVELDGNKAEGVLTFATDGRQTLQGTLAAEQLDITPYLSTVKLMTGDQRQWNSGQIGLDGLNGIDLDLRLSSGKVTTSNVTFGRTALAANLRNGQLVITVGEAQAFGGVVRGSIALANFDHGVDVKSQLLFSDVDFESCLGQLVGLRRLEGKGTIALNVEGSGRSVMGVTRTLHGKATLSGADGALAGLNIEQLLRRLERRPLSGGGEFRSGRTPYSSIGVALKIEQGKIGVDEMKLEGTAVRVGLGGSASIPDRDLDLKGTAALTIPARAGTQPFELPFIVQGSWDDPIMLPDPEALIRRSGAAAPLLNAIRERNAGDQVRSAIERLTGGALPAAERPQIEQAPAKPE